MKTIALRTRDAIASVEIHSQNKNKEIDALAFLQQEMNTPIEVPRKKVTDLVVVV
jgi:hypothetical protein